MASTFWQSIFNRRSLICVFTGFSSGLPLYILVTLVPAWLRTEEVSLKDIGLFAVIQIFYNLKFLWAPIIDRFSLPFLGLRRGWLLVVQLCLLISIGLLPVFDIQTSLAKIAFLAAIVVFFSATQDIVIDAYRRELLPDEELGFGNSVHTNAYRIAGLIPGSLSLILSDHLPWEHVFPITGLFMLLGIGMTLVIAEPEHRFKPHSFREAVVEPFTEFFLRQGIKQGALVIAFIVLYKLGDNMATALSTPFYIDMGYSKTEIGIVAKNAALWPTVIGSFIGGMLMIKIGINRALWLFGVVQLVSIFGYALLVHMQGTSWLLEHGHFRLWLLAMVIGFEYLGVGLGTAASVAFIARSTNRMFTAVQFALLTAVAALPRTFANAATGFMVESIGWETFFYYCALFALPGMLLLAWVAPWNGEKNALTGKP